MAEFPISTYLLSCVCNNYLYQYYAKGCIKKTPLSSSGFLVQLWSAAGVFHAAPVLMIQPQKLNRGVIKI